MNSRIERFCQPLRAADGFNEVLTNERFRPVVVKKIPSERYARLVIVEIFV